MALLASALSHVNDVLDDLDDDFNLPLIIALSSGLGVLFLALLLLTVYFSFFNSGGAIFLGSSFNIPGEFDDLERMRNEEEDALPKMSPEERDDYLTAKQFQEEFPPDAKPLGSVLTEAEQEYITDRGIQAYFFEHALEQSSSTPEVTVEDKLDVHFASRSSCSAILNYPLPVKDNDAVYFEVKIFEMGTDALVSIGLATKPYPLFRLPGHNRYSFSYESDGTVRVNQPFYSPSIWSKLIEGDVVGCGLRPRSGTIFFTHNGKKVVEAAHNVKFDMYPIIGSRGSSKLSVNLGQLGFVFIEANVKKWGFGPVFGTIGVPPAYGKEITNDAVLDKGEELPPKYPSEEETFFGPSALLNHNCDGDNPASSSDVSLSDTPPVVLKSTKIISKLPSYSDEPKDAHIPTVRTVEEDDEEAERLYERRSSTFDLQRYQDASTFTDPLEQGQTHITELPAQEEELVVSASMDASADVTPESTPEPVTTKKGSSVSTKSKNKKKNKKGKKRGRK